VTCYITSLLRSHPCNVGIGLAGNRIVGTLGASGCFWWNSLHDFGAPFINSSLLSQVLSSSGCPLHLTRYCNLSPCYRRTVIVLSDHPRWMFSVRLANSKARIKPTAPLSAFDKENSIEFLLDLVHYIYMQSNPNPVLLSHASL